MEETAHLTPRISVIVPGLLGYETVSTALAAWERQTCRRDIEIIVLSPDAPRELPPRVRVLDTKGLLLHEARARAIREADGDYIMLAEDHCLPDADCMEAMLERVGERWDAIGPSLRPGVTGSVAMGSFLISYAQWLHPQSGPVDHLPGHNAVIRKAPLIAMGRELEEQLIGAMFLMATLKSQGARFFVDAHARMRHFDVPDLVRSGRIFFAVGKGCGAMRTRRSSRGRRAFHAVLAPLVAARHFSRGAGQYIRAGRSAGFGAGSISASAVFACVWAAGESVGALKGIERVKPGLWISEIKPVIDSQAIEQEGEAARQRVSLSLTS